LLKRFNYILCFLIVTNISILYTQDDTLVYKTRTIEIDAPRFEKSKIMSYSDIHHIEISEIDRLKNSNITDIIKYIPNTYIKDYGGIGGIKTISLRGAASCQTAVLIDGIPISSSQNSIVDFSLLPLTFFDNIDVVTNSSSSLFGTNSIGGAIDLHSRIQKSKSFNISASIGSFGYSTISTSANSTLFKIPYFINFNYIKSKDNYPFDYNEFGKIISVMRQNADISILNGAACFVIPIKKYLFTNKLFITNSERGVPGAVITGKIENSLARLNEFKLLNLSNCYMKIDSNINNEIKLLLSYNSSDYNDKGFLPNDNFANSYFISRDVRIIDDFSINNNRISNSLNIIFQYSNLSGNKLSLDVGNYVERLNLGIGNNLSCDLLRMEEFTLSALLSAKYDYWSDIKNVLSYTAGIYGKNIFDNTDIKLMYSNNYRIPNFNEMYYLNYGTTNLKPEKSNSYSLSVDFLPIKLFNINLNCYYISTKNQILSVPKSTISWAAQNIGNVHNYGASVSIQSSLFHNSLFLMFAFTHQKSIDKTDNSPSYNNLLPYLPKEIVSFMMNYKYNVFSIGTDIYYNSFRYYLMDNSLNSLMNSYYNIDINLSYIIKLLSNNLTISLIIKNITNQTYEIINNYPMPKRSYVISINYNIR